MALHLVGDAGVFLDGTSDSGREEAKDGDGDGRACEVCSFQLFALNEEEDLHNHKDKGARSELSGRKMMAYGFDRSDFRLLLRPNMPLQESNTRGRKLSLLREELARFWVFNFLLARINNGLQNRRD